MDIKKIKELALANGFKLKEQADGSMDLNAYVYDFANAIEQAAKAQAVPEGFEIGRLQDRITELLDERQELYAQLDAGSTEGFVLRPKEPTQEMIQAGLEKVRESWDDAPPDGFNSFTWGDMVATWKAMIEAQEQAND